MRISRFSLTLLAGLAIPAVCHATPVTDKLTLTYGGQTLTLDLPFDPTPVSFGPNYNFVVDGKAIFTNGATCTDSLEFYTDPTGGGGFSDSCIPGLAPYTDQGVLLFTGTVMTPTFASGIYNFDAKGGPGTLVIEQIAEMPEPSPLLLLGTGILGLAGVLQWKTRRSSTSH